MRLPSNKYKILVSFALWNRKAIDYEVIKQGNLDLFLDSGAFTNFKSGKEVAKLDDYIHFIKENKKIVWKYINLDVIGDEKQSQYNFEQMERAGLKPIPVFTRSNISAKEKAETLKKMCDKHEFIALGGIAGIKTKTGKEYLKNLCHFIKKNTKTKFHILGCGSLRIAKNIRPFSMDSSTSSSNMAFGAVGLFNKKGRNVVRFNRFCDYKYLKKHETLLKKYGVTPKSLHSDNFWNVGNYDERVILNQYSYYKMQVFLAKNNILYWQALSMPHLKLWHLMEKHYGV